MRGVNHCILAGNLGRDPELRSTQSGTAVCNFSIAVNETWTDKGGEQCERTEWVNIVTWERTAENCAKYLTKGSPVFVVGKMQTRDWTDRDGNERKSTEIQAQRVEFLGGPSEKQGGISDSGSGEDRGVSDDEIPF